MVAKVSVETADLVTVVTLPFAVDTCVMVVAEAGSWVVFVMVAVTVGPLTVEPFAVVVEVWVRVLVRVVVVVCGGRTSVTMEVTRAVTS